MATTLETLERDFEWEQREGVWELRCVYCGKMFGLDTKDGGLFVRLGAIAKHQPCSMRKGE